MIEMAMVKVMAAVIASLIVIAWSSTYLRMLVDFKKDPESLKVLIKTDDKATCKNFIDLVDELKIAEVGVIAPVDILASELELLKQNAK